VKWTRDHQELVLPPAHHSVLLLVNPYAVFQLDRHHHLHHQDHRGDRGLLVLQDQLDLMVPQDLQDHQDHQDFLVHQDPQEHQLDQEVHQEVQDLEDHPDLEDHLDPQDLQDQMDHQDHWEHQLHHHHHHHHHVQLYALHNVYQPVHHLAVHKRSINDKNGIWNALVGWITLTYFGEYFSTNVSKNLHHIFCSRIGTNNITEETIFILLYFLFFITVGS